MILVAAIALALFALPSPWGAVVVAAALVVEIAETWFWIWLLRRIPIRAGAETLIGARAEVVRECRPTGQVRVQGELWRARSEGGAEPGEHVRVRGIDGLTLLVEREGAPCG